MRLTVTTAKYILVPIIIAIFIVYSGYCLYIHVTQTPGISLQLSSELPPLPYLAFVLPYGPAVATLFNTLPSLPTPTWPFAALDPVRDAQLPPQQLNAFGGHPISDYFTVRNRSFNSRSIQDLVSNVSTVYTMDPRNRKWDPPSRWWPDPVTSCAHL
ncbi:hypothetical protein DFS34DRAFT_66945 [Phlyctochytrium arcticum]|nr:hypothetical protein DFS34DRAFT_66945 [Phlyctochytrium arcticum]